MSRGARVKSGRPRWDRVKLFPMAALALALVTCSREPTRPSAGSSEAASSRVEREAGGQAARSAPERAELAAAGTPSAEPSAPPGPPPLRAESELVALEVPEFRPAVVALPLGATSAKPVVVALHGNFDRPEWQCEVWRGVVGARAFVLCPRGSPRRDVPASLDRWEYGSAERARAEVIAALGALRARFAEYVDDGPITFIGFSLGAILGARWVDDPELRVQQAVFVEGGEKGWTLARARAFHAAAGRKVLFACGQSPCRHGARQAAAVFERGDVAARVADASPAGHTYDGKVAAAVAEHWAWLVEGDPRWAAPGAEPPRPAAPAGSGSAPSAHPKPQPAGPERTPDAR